MRVAAVQLAAESFDRAEVALEAALAAIAACGEQDADLVVLPECSWPAYVIGTEWEERWPRSPSTDDVLDAFAAAARDAGVVVVAGVAVPVAGALFNRALVWERDGSLVGHTDKRFLWDFDQRWFRAGVASPVIPTSAGVLGVLVCADGRMPEIARTLAVAGAEILVDPTAWVTGQPDPATWSNPQYEHMLPTRAVENGLHVVAANKVGIEADGVAYCGRSCIVAPDGTRLAVGPPDAPAIVVADCQIGAPRWPVARRPELYGLLVAPTEKLPVQAVLAEPVVPRHSRRRVAVSALDGAMDVAQRALVADLGAHLIVTHAIEDAARGAWSVVRVGDHADLCANGEVVATWLRTHGDDAPGDELGPVIDTPAGRIGALVGDDGLSPEGMRTLMLLGADLVVWFVDGDVGPVAATRAAENRVHLVVAGRHRAVVLDPDGRALASSGSLARIISASVDLCAGREKEMAPGTDVVLGRQPESYASLTTPVPTD